MSSCGGFTGNVDVYVESVYQVGMGKRRECFLETYNWWMAQLNGAIKAFAKGAKESGQSQHGLMWGRAATKICFVNY